MRQPIYLPNLTPVIRHATLKTKWSFSYDSIEFINNKRKKKHDGTHKAKLSCNKPELTSFKTSSMNITIWHTSRMKFPIYLNKEKKDFFREGLEIYLNLNYVWNLFIANQYIEHTLLIYWTERTTTCLTEDSKESTLFYYTKPFNLSWKTKKLCRGLLTIP